MIYSMTNLIAQLKLPSDTLLNEVLGNLYDVIPMPWSAVLLVVCAIICGLLIGIEREVRDKPAGLRTQTLICFGSTVFTIVSILMASDGNADRSRIAAQIVTGVGFLGAGAIIRHRGEVIGLTTAATIWAVAAVGMIIGSGYAAAGIALTVVVLALQTLLRPFEKHHSSNDSHGR
jgi:putative Mg2+ transporter-C (MgtC) family protein